MFEQIFTELANQGIIDTAIPTLLVFALFYAVLYETEVISKKKGINTVISFSFGLLFAYFGNQIYVDSGITLVQLINHSILDVTIIILAVIMLFVLLGSIGYNGVNFANSSYTKWGFILFSLFIVVFIFMHTAGFLPSNISSTLSSYTESLSLLVPIAVFGLVIYFVVSEPVEEDDDKDNVKDKAKEIINDIGKAVDK